MFAPVATTFEDTLHVMPLRTRLPVILETLPVTLMLDDIAVFVPAIDRLAPVRLTLEEAVTCVPVTDKFAPAKLTFEATFNCPPFNQTLADASRLDVIVRLAAVDTVPPRRPSIAMSVFAANEPFTQPFPVVMAPAVFDSIVTACTENT
jgi:hypothetical protein